MLIDVQRSLRAHAPADGSASVKGGGDCDDGVATTSSLEVREAREEGLFLECLPLAVLARVRCARRLRAAVNDRRASMSVPKPRDAVD